MLEGSVGTASGGDSFVVDCDDCLLQDSLECDDCLVTFLINRTANEAVIVSADEARAMKLLSGGGLVPSLRHLPRTG